MRRIISFYFTQCFDQHFKSFITIFYIKSNNFVKIEVEVSIEWSEVNPKLALSLYSI